MAKNLQTTIQVKLVQEAIYSLELWLLNFSHLPTITAISWPQPWISQLFLWLHHF